MIVLKPCPFCGGIPQQPQCYRGIDEISRPKWGMVQCTNCGAQSGDVRTGYGPVADWCEDAAIEWNKRVEDET